MQQRNESAKHGAAEPKERTQPASGEPESNSASKDVQTPSPSRRGGRILLITLAVLAAAAIAYRYMAAPQEAQQAATQAAPPPAPPVTVSKPLIEKLREWSDFTGQFEAPDAVEIRARVSG